MRSTNTTVTEIANELGFYPGRAQVTKISQLAIQKYAQLQADGSAPASGCVPENIIKDCNEWAIREVMGRSARFRATITGTPGDELNTKIMSALSRASGKTLRVRIEEILPAKIAGSPLLNSIACE